VGDLLLGEAPDVNLRLSVHQSFTAKVHHVSA
jgi:hypothetical protein